MRSLYKTCAGHNLLPRSLHFELGEDPIGVVLYSGGFGDVWKREYDGRDVAVKVLRPHYDIGSRDIIHVGRWWASIPLRVLVNWAQPL